MDTMFTEAARAIVHGLHGNDEEIASELFRRILTRIPDREELNLLVDFYRAQRTRLESQALSHVTMLGNDCDGSASLAAWMMVARAIYNLDEAVTKG